jgi:hypothetical protein
MLFGCMPAIGGEDRCKVPGKGVMGGSSGPQSEFELALDCMISVLFKA